MNAIIIITRNKMTTIGATMIPMLDPPSPPPSPLAPPESSMITVDDILVPVLLLDIVVSIAVVVTDGMIVVSMVDGDKSLTTLVLIMVGVEVAAIVEVGVTVGDATVGDATVGDATVGDTVERKKNNHYNLQNKCIVVMG